MIVLVHGFCHKDVQPAVRFFEWVYVLNKGQLDRMALLVSAKSVTNEDRDCLIRVAKQAFRSVAMIVPLEDGPNEWTAKTNDARGPNLLWQSAVQYMQQQTPNPWLWTEPDVVPTNPRWLDWLEYEYARGRKPFMGYIYDLPFPHMNGVGVYPHNVCRYSSAMAFNQSTVPWDLYDAKRVLKLCHSTNLIQRSLAVPSEMKQHHFESADDLRIIHPNVVLFHGCSDGSLANVLQAKPKLKVTGANRHGSIIVRRSGAIGDSILAATVVTAFRENGYPVVYQTNAASISVLKHIRDKDGLADLTLEELRSPNAYCQVNLDGVYENHEDRTSRHWRDLFFEGANRKTRILLSPSNHVTRFQRKSTLNGSLGRRLRRHAYPGPWIAICPQSDSWPNRTISRDTWKQITKALPGTCFWVGTNRPVSCCVDTKCQTIEDVFNVLVYMDLLITVDTGPMYIAAGLGVPVLAIEQASSPELHLTDQQDFKTVRPDLSCLNCQKAKCPINEAEPPCSRIEPRKVIDTVSKWFNTKVSAVMPIRSPSVPRINRALTELLLQVNDIVVPYDADTVLPDHVLKSESVRYVRHLKPDLGYGKKANFGARHTFGEFIWFMNDDVIPDPDALKYLLEVMESNKRAGCVGHLLWYPGRTEIQHGGPHRESPADIGWGHLDHHKPTPTITEPCEVEFVTGASVLVRRSAFYEIGGYDERYYLYWEDADFALRLRRANWQVWYTPKAQGVHEEHATTNLMGEPARGFSHSQVLFKNQWNDYFQANPPKFKRHPAEMLGSFSYLCKS